MDPTDLFLTSMVVTLFNFNYDFTQSHTVFLVTFFIAMNGNEPQGPFIPPQLKLKIHDF